MSDQEVRRIAGLELNALNLSGALPSLDGVRLRTAGTVVHDLNGEPLFRRMALSRSAGSVGYADVAIDAALGGPLLATSVGEGWNEPAVRAEAKAAAERLGRQLRYDSMRFVAYSYPKIALQFLRGQEEVLMLEWKSWAPVPPAERGDREPMQPSNFERWSLLDELPSRTKLANARGLEERVSTWGALRADLDVSVISRERFSVTEALLQMTDTRQVGYAPHPGDHTPCYELRAQRTPVWCVAASTEMLLDFYRYSYDQIRIADELGLGTCATPSGLPYSQVGKVVTVIEKLTSNSLDATMYTNPGWTVFRDEVRANRPLISFIPGHSRTVAGYTSSMIHLPGQLPFRGLLVYDPWPPGPAAPGQCSSADVGGVITTWENFATQTYQYAYSAVLRQV